jgi:hypothetical protein
LRRLDGQKSARVPATATGLLLLRDPIGIACEQPDDVPRRVDVVGRGRRRPGPPPMRKRKKAKKPIPCKSPVNRLYLQARQNLT